MTVLLLASLAQGAETTLWAKQLVGVGAFPLGALSDTRVQARRPGHRSDSILFRDTYYGAGARLQVSPAFVDVGPRISIAPVDVFDLDLQGSWTGYAGPYSPLPMTGTAGSLESLRNERSGEGTAMHKLELAASPTFKAKVGPIVAFESTTVAYVHAFRSGTTPFWYEPYRDLVLADRDVSVETQGAVLYEVLPGGDRPKLWLGGTARHRAALESGDRQSNAGGLVVCRPGTAPSMPTFVAQVLPWVATPERQGTAPAVNVAASWTVGG